MKIFENNKSYLLKYKSKNILSKLESNINKIYEGLFNLHHNDEKESFDIPYINREYYNHTFKPNEDAIIGFYVDDNSESFYNKDKVSYYKLYIYIDNEFFRNDYIKSGSQKMNLGKLSLGEHIIAYEVIDIYNRKSYRDYFEIRVKEDTVISKYIITDEDLARYSIDKTGNDYENTVTGFNTIINNLDSKYNYLVIPNGTYQMKYGEKISLKDNLTLDLNDSHFTLQPNQAGDKNMQFEIRQCYDSHIINGTIEGDLETHDFDNSSNNSEWVNCVDLNGRSKYSSYSNITVKNVTGYGTCEGISGDRNEDSKSYTFAIVSISKSYNNKNDRDESDFIDLTKYKVENCNYFQVGLYLGYQGCPSNCWYYTIQFFDENKTLVDDFIGYFYRRIYIPKNVKYCKIQSLKTFKLNNNTTSFAFKTPVNCEFNNVKHYECRCVGCAPSGMESLRLIGCYFTKCGKSGATCAFDSEDGWDLMHDFYMTNTVFENNYRNDWLTCAGHNFLLENNNYPGKIYLYSRCQNFTIRNNNVLGISSNDDKYSHHSRIYNNICSETITNKKILIKNCSAKSITGPTKKCIFTSLSGNNIISNNSIIYLTDNSGYIASPIIINSKFILKDCDSANLQFNGLDNNVLFKNCDFSGGQFFFGTSCNSFNSGDFINCNIENLFIQPYVFNDTARGIIKFENCKINFNSALIRLSPFAYSIGKCEIVFNNCELTDTGNELIYSGSQFYSKSDLIYLFSKPTSGSITFKDCIINKTNGKLIDGYPGSGNEIEKQINFEIIFDNTPITDNLLEITDKFKPYIQITQK